jgi:hypothetical protein
MEGPTIKMNSKQNNLALKLKTLEYYATRKQNNCALYPCVAGSQLHLIAYGNNLK